MMRASSESEEPQPTTTSNDDGFSNQGNWPTTNSDSDIRLDGVSSYSDCGKWPTSTSSDCDCDSGNRWQRLEKAINSDWWHRFSLTVPVDKTVKTTTSDIGQGQAKTDWQWERPAATSKDYCDNNGDQWRQLAGTVKVKSVATNNSDWQQLLW